MRWQWLLGLGLTCLASGGCLISETIQTPPAVSGIVGPSLVSRNSTEPFSVDTQHKQIEWGWFSGVCPSNLAAQESSSLGETIALGATFVVKTETIGPVCLWARVTNDGGAQALVWKDVMVRNAGPIAKVAAITPFVAAPSQFELYSPLRFTASGTVDPDGDALATFAWTITPAQGAPLTATPCTTPINGMELCFTPPTSGMFKIGVVVIDALGVSSAVPGTLDIVVAPDRAPCLRDTEQANAGTATLLRRWDEDVAFAVAVDDDGDPYPARENQPSNVAFTWYFRKVDSGNAAFVAITEYSDPKFRLAAKSFKQGDQVQVRVQVADRLALPVSCDEEEALCEKTPASKCTQRLTWTVRYVL